MGTQLMEAFNFDEEDLAANRAGSLSTKQKEQMRKNEVFGNWVVAVVGLLSAVGAVLLLLPLVRAGRVPSDKITNLVFGVILVFVTFWMLRGLFTKSGSNEVCSVRGKARLVKSVSRSGNVSDAESDRTNVVKHELVVEGEAFFITPDVFNTVLHEGETYAVYFTENPQLLLSLEHIPSD